MNDQKQQGENESSIGAVALDRRVSLHALWPFANAHAERPQQSEAKPLTAKTMAGRHAQRMKRLALTRARWEKGNGSGWEHKRKRAVHDALAYRDAQHRAG